MQENGRNTEEQEKHNARNCFFCEYNYLQGDKIARLIEQIRRILSHRSQSCLFSEFVSVCGEMKFQLNLCYILAMEEKLWMWQRLLLRTNFIPGHCLSSKASFKVPLTYVDHGIASSVNSTAVTYRTPPMHHVLGI